MANNEKEVAPNANSYEASPEFNVAQESTGEVKLDWKSVIRKYMSDKGASDLISEEESTPWNVRREDMGLTPLESEDSLPWYLNREDMGLPPLGGTTLKEVPQLPTEKSKSEKLVFVTDSKVNPDMLEDTLPHSADNTVNFKHTTAFAERIKHVNNNLNPTQTVEDNKPKLK